MKRFFSFALVCIMLLSVIVGIIPPIEASAAGNAGVERYTVLILDTMGQYTITTPSGNVVVSASLDKVKEAGEKFISSVIAAGGNDQIAIVKCSNTSTIAQNFSNNQTQLSSAVRNLRGGDGFSDVNHAFELADDLLSNAPKDAICNIVYFSGCVPAAGDYDETGYYSKDIYDYTVIATGVFLYAHANSVYNTVSSISKKGYKIYTLGCVTNLAEQAESYNFFMRFMKDIANAGYYDAEHPEDLIFIFEKIAQDIVNPLRITLYCEKIMELVPEKIDDTTTAYRMRYLYEITATIENTDARTARAVECSFVCPTQAVPLADMIYKKQDDTQIVGDIPAGESRTVTWYMEVEHPTDEISVIYGVIAKAENAVRMEKSDIVYVEPFAQTNSNIFTFGIDQWSFVNSHNFFNNQACNETYYILENDYNALCSVVSKTDKESVDDILDDPWGGSCYGMSITAILAKIGVLKPENMQAGKDSLFEISKTNNDNIESIINYYHVSQKLLAVDNAIDRFDSLTPTQKIQYIEAEASKVPEGGTPVLIAFNFSTGGAHAVVAYGAETGEWSFGGGIFGIGAKKYNSRILVYDCNAPSDQKNSCIYYNSGKNDFYIPNYPNMSRFIFATSNIEILDPYNYNVTVKNYNSSISAHNLTDYLLKTNGKEYQLNAETYDPENGVYVRFDICGNSENSNMYLVVPANTSYSLSNQIGSECDMSIRSQNGLWKINLISSDDISMNEQNDLSINNIEGAYTISLTTDDGLWDTIDIVGSDAGNLVLKQTKNALIVEGTNLQNLDITTKSDEEEFSTTVSTLHSSILITATEDEDVVVLIDANGDGDFDTPINGTKSYVITFDANGGVTSADTIHTDTTGKLPEIPLAGRSGYNFMGWYTDKEQGEKVTLQTIFEGNTTVYARWKKISYAAPDVDDVYVDNWDDVSSNTSFIDSLANSLGITSGQLFIIAGEIVAVILLAAAIVIVLVLRKRR